MAETVDIEPVLRQAAAELATLQTVTELRDWWKKHYLVLGHRRLGRLFIGQPIERLLPGRERERD